MEKGQKFIADAIRKRLGQVGKTTVEAAREGPSRDIIGKAERSGVLPSRPATRAKLATTLNWPSDACDLLERGQVPQESLGSLTKEEVRDVVRTIRFALDSLESRLDREG